MFEYGIEETFKVKKMLSTYQKFMVLIMCLLMPEIMQGRRHVKSSPPVKVERRHMTITVTVCLET
jgi:hypothetical protein